MQTRSSRLLNLDSHVAGSLISRWIRLIHLALAYGSLAAAFFCVSSNFFHLTGSTLRRRNLSKNGCFVVNELPKNIWQLKFMKMLDLSCNALEMLLVDSWN
jgi:hypothetical protein